MLSSEKNCRFFAEYGRRLYALKRLLKVTEVEWVCYSVLCQDHRPISETSLAEHVKAPKTTVRSNLLKGLARDLIERTPTGLRLTERGTNVMRRLHHETYEIALGTRKGYSYQSLEDIRAHLSNAHRRSKMDKLKTIQFQPAILLELPAQSPSQQSNRSIFTATQE